MSQLKLRRLFEKSHNNSHPQKLHIQLLTVITMMVFAAVLSVNAQTQSIDFENFNSGPINGQQGWGNGLNPGGAGCQTYDHNIKTNDASAPVSFGAQSFQISNYITSGCFDQTFSSSTTEAGETSAVNSGNSVGPRQKHFEVRFDIAAAVPGAPPELDSYMSVSPDRGDGARMSYLRFEDQNDGIHVIFDEYIDAAPTGGANADPAGCALEDDFTDELIATLSRSSAHNIRFVMDFVDGPRNDVVKIYIDGALTKTGTSWEDYFRYCAEQAPNNVPTVDSVLFRTGGGDGITHSTNQGKGFLIDNVFLPRNFSTVVAPYNVFTEFSINSNPNAEYTYGNTADADRNSAFTAYVQPRMNAFSTPGIDGWYRGVQDIQYGVPGVYTNTNAATTQYVDAPSVVHPANMLMLHPGQLGERSVVRFTAPAAGNYQINGQFQGVDTNGTSTDVLVLSRSAADLTTSTELSSGVVNGYGATNSAAVVPFAVPFVTLAAGDVIEFSVGTGNGSFAADSTGLQATIEPSETDAPTLVSITPSSGAFNVNPITFTFTFSEPVINFDASDISVTNGTPSAPVSTDGGFTYTSNITAAADGSVTVSVAAGAATDLAQNPTNNGGSATVNYDATTPTIVSVAGVPAGPTNATTITFTATFSEAIASCNAAGFVVTNGTGGTPTLNGSTCTVEVNNPTGSPVTLTVNPGAAQDAAGNTNLDSASASVVFDGMNPTVTISPTAADTVSTAASPVNFTVVFSETVSDFDDFPGDVLISGTAFGANSNPRATIMQVAPNDGTTYKVAVKGMNATGSVIISVPGGAATDGVNPSTASTTPGTVTFNLPANQPVVVSAANLQGWSKISQRTADGNFVTGPAAPPLPIGSYRLTTGPGNAGPPLPGGSGQGGKTWFATQQYEGTLLADVTELKYSTFVSASPSSTQVAPVLTFQVDIDGNGTRDAAMNFEPTYSAVTQGIVKQGEWQNWDARAGIWYFTNNNITNTPGNTFCPTTCYNSYSDIIAAYPNARMVNWYARTDGFGTQFVAGMNGPGAPWNDFVGNIDNFIIGVNSSGSAFDYEPAPPTVSIGNASATEGGTATFTVSLADDSPTRTFTVSVDVSTADIPGQATAGALNDYVAKTQTLSFAPGVSSQDFTVTTNSDSVDEPDETFAVNLSNAVNAAIGTGAGVGTINDNNATPEVTLVTTSTSNVTEGTTATFSAHISGASSTATTITITTTSGTATTPADYSLTTTSVTFPANSTADQTVSVTTADDTLYEGSETFSVALGSVTAGTASIGSPSSQGGTINDNETCSYVINPTAANVLNTAGNYQFTVATTSGCPVSAAVTMGSFISNVSISPDPLTGGPITRTVSYTVASNAATPSNSGAQRSGVITVTGLGFTGTYTVTQAAAPVEVFIPNNQSGLTGSTLTVPVNIASIVTGRNITTYEFTVQYDTRVLTPILDPGTNQPAFDTTGTLSTGFSVGTSGFANGANNAVINVSGSSANPIVGGPGTLIYLKFTVSGMYDATACTPLSFAQYTNPNVTFPAFEFNNGDPAVNTTAGQACVIAGDVSGRVVYGNPTTTTSGVPNVTLTATNGSNTFSTTSSAMTGTLGSYSLSGFTGMGPYTVTPTKPSVPATTPSANNPIRTADASLIQQYRLGLAPLTPRQLIAADVDKNGVVQTFDASLIQQYRLLAVNPASHVGEWVFIPANRTYPTIPANVSGQDYDAILLGDVDGDYTLLAIPLRTGDIEKGEQTKELTNPVDAQFGAVSVVLPSNASTSSGSNITIPINVSNLNGPPVTAYEFDIRYDPNILQPVANAASGNGTLSSGFSIGSAVIGTGLLRVSASSGTPIVGENGILINVTFRAIGANGTNSPLSFDAFIFNAGSPPNTTNVGQVQVLAPTAAAASISGRVRSAAGKPAIGVTVTLTDSNGVARSVKTSLKGLYRFDEVPTGGIYTIVVSDKFTSGAPQAITLVGDMSAFDLIF